MNQSDLGSNPRAGAVDQAVHPSGVGKLVAISMQWVTAVQGCEGKRAAVSWLTCGLGTMWCYYYRILVSSG